MRKTLSTTGNPEVHGCSRHLVRVPLFVRITRHSYGDLGMLIATPFLRVGDDPDGIISKTLQRLAAKDLRVT